MVETMIVFGKKLHVSISSACGNKYIVFHGGNSYAIYLSTVGLDLCNFGPRSIKYPSISAQNWLAAEIIDLLQNAYFITCVEKLIGAWGYQLLELIRIPSFDVSGLG